MYEPAGQMATDTRLEYVVFVMSIQWRGGRRLWGGTWWVCTVGFVGKRAESVVLSTIQSAEFVPSITCIGAKPDFDAAAHFLVAFHAKTLTKGDDPTLSKRWCTGQRLCWCGNDGDKKHCRCPHGKLCKSHWWNMQSVEGRTLIYGEMFFPIYL